VVPLSSTSSDVPSANPAWPASRTSSDFVPVEVVSLPSKGDGRTPGVTVGTFSLSSLPAVESPGCATTTFLFLNDISTHQAKMFDAKQWSEVTFFEVEDFSSCSSSSAGSSLADTATLDDHMRREINYLETKLFFDDLNAILNAHKASSNVPYTHYDPGASPQKRQKIFDYAQEGHSIATKDAPKLDDLNSPADSKPFTEKPSAQ
jgi:hypothetical protein